MVSTVKVYGFRKYDIVRDEFITSRRMATRACIDRIRASPLKNTELEIDSNDVDKDGMTDIGYYEIKLRKKSYIRIV